MLINQQSFSLCTLYPVCVEGVIKHQQPTSIFVYTHVYVY